MKISTLFFCSIAVSLPSLFWSGCTSYAVNQESSISRKLGEAEAVQIVSNFKLLPIIKSVRYGQILDLDVPPGLAISDEEKIMLIPRVLKADHPTYCITTIDANGFEANYYGPTSVRYVKTKARIGESAEIIDIKIKLIINRTDPVRVKFSEVNKIILNRHDGWSNNYGMNFWVNGWKNAQFIVECPVGEHKDWVSALTTLCKNAK